MTPEEPITNVSGQHSSDSRLKLAMDAALVGTWERNLLTGRDIWSEQQEALFGLAPGTFHSTHQSFLERIYPDDRQSVEDAVQRAINGNSRYESEYRIRWPDGSFRWLTGRGNIIRDANGRATHMVGLTMDITQRKLAEQRLATEHAVSHILSNTSSLPEAIPLILEAICQTTRWQWAAMWTVDAQSNVLRCVDVWHLQAVDLGNFERHSYDTTFAPGIGLPGRVWSTGQPASITDVTLDDNFPRKVAAAQVGLHGAVAFPVVLRDEVLGVMEFFSREVRPPDEPLLAMMQSIGAQVGRFIDRRRVDQGLRDSEARNTAILEAALDCIVSMDHEGNITEWNPAAQRTFGFTRSESVGRKMAELIIPPSLRDAHRKGLARYLSTGEGQVIGKRIEITAVRKDGSEFPVELAITPVKSEGPPTFTGYLRDITDRKLGETERNRLLASEQDARQSAEKANRMKDEFLSIVSHELRTPLNAILGWSQLLGNGGKMDEADLREGLKVIERNARVQTQIIEDILDMSRIISGKVRLDVQRVDLPRVIDAAIESMQPAATARGVRLQKVLDPLAGPVSGDPARLQQIVWNLISNSIKYTPREGRVRVTLERVNSHVEISVSDTGEGIKPEFLPYVFERFRQAESATTRKHGGLGLGLSIVKQLVELHGGTVQAKSPGEGKGSTFRVALPLTPLRRDDDDHLRHHPKTTSAEDFEYTAPTLGGITVLVVDDEPDARNLLKRLLQDRGADATTCSSVNEALGLIGDLHPDVILSDIGMPERDGYDFVRALRSLPPDKGGTIPAVALTAFARSEDRTRAMMAGFDVHIAKPVEPNELCAVVARLAGRAAAADPEK
jgi:PAS domain S-box-containing protein